MKFIRSIYFLILVLSMSVQANFSYAHETADSNASTLYFSGLDSDPAKAVQQFHLALQTGNSDLAASLLADQVIIFEGGKIERSKVEYTSAHLKSDIAFMAKMKVKLLEHQVIVSGNMAISLATSNIQGTYKNKAVNSQTMETIVLKLEHGQWKIIHIHWS